jgi:hypothetical protein
MRNRLCGNAGGRQVLTLGPRVVGPHQPPDRASGPGHPIPRHPCPGPAFLPEDDSASIIKGKTIASILTHALGVRRVDSRAVSFAGRL